MSSTGLILDASATLSWLIERADPSEAKQSGEMLLTLRSEDALVPALWFPEVANGLLVAERRGGVDSARVARFLERVNALPIQEDSLRPSAAQSSVMNLARAYALTAYDATYLELAIRTQAVLATFDRKLAQAARSIGVKVFGDSV